MESLLELHPLTSLQNIITKMGWYTGKSQLLITYEGAFEGFYGKASEDWEQQATVELKEVSGTNGQIICPGIKVKGLPYESVEDVARKVVKLYEKWVADSN
ncbi:MAG: hypothetical protein V4615_04990 [Bacteroidota bacterium]